MNSKTDDLFPASPAIDAQRKDLPSTTRIDVFGADETCDGPALRPFDTPTPNYLDFLRLFR